MESKQLFLKFLPNSYENLAKLYNLDPPSRGQEAVTILDIWVKKQHHFTKKDFPIRILEASLVTCKGSIEKAKKQIDRLCTLRTLLPMYFEISNIREEFADVLNVGTPLPMPTDDNYRVFMIKIQKNHLQREKVLQFFKLNVIMADYFVKNDFVNGFIFFDDLRDVNLLDLMSCLSMTDLQQILTILIEGYGTRIKGVHILTESKTVDVLVNSTKPFISEKIANRIRVHPTIEDLHKSINKDILPIEYGGKERSHSELCADWVNELCSPDHLDHCKIMRQARTDESLRLLDKFNEDYLGMAGTFRSLTVD